MHKPEVTKLAKPWIDAIGNHMWRFYYSRRNADPAQMGPASRKQWEACHRAITRFNTEEQNVMQMYYMTEWGHDLHAVEDYSARSGMTVNNIWNIIKTANRAAAEERGLIDKRREE